ncbi:MAG TPA: glycosyltransferase family A protein [Flavobacteriales bacterium]|nr:glycosyltransferase family A protein [Flavobacteriales bacterium]
MKISVVIPCFNAEHHFGRCIESIFGQTHRDLEITVVDDGSSDGTLREVKDAAARSPFPYTVLEQANVGACAARNAGMAASSGQFIQFMDADDALHPEKIAHQVELLHTHHEPDLIVGSAHTYDHRGQLLSTDVQHPGKRDVWMDLMQHKLGGTPTNLWRRSMMERVGGWNVAMKSSQEYDLMFRFLQNGARLFFDERVNTDIHQRESGSVSTAKLDGTWSRFIDLRTRIIAHVKATRPDKDLGPYHQVLFDSIRTLYPHAPAEAVALYRKHIPKDFSPSVSPATGRGYLLLHNVLGFSLANRVRQAL